MYDENQNKRLLITPNTSSIKSINIKKKEKEA